MGFLLGVCVSGCPLVWGFLIRATALKTEFLSMLKYLKINYGHPNKEPQTRDLVTLPFTEFGESNLPNLISYIGPIPG